MSTNDPTLARVIASQQARWPSQPTEEPIWGLIRIIMAQQISTGVACRLAERVKCVYPMLTTPSPATLLDRNSLCALGLSERRAQCCITILRRSEEIRANVRRGQPWEDAIAGIKVSDPGQLQCSASWSFAIPMCFPWAMSDSNGLSQTSMEGPVASSVFERWRPFDP